MTDLNEFVREIAILRDVPAGNEVAKQDPGGMLQTLIEEARRLLEMPPWQEPRPASALTKQVTAARIREKEIEGDEIIPEFWRLVSQANVDGLAVDDFDVYTENIGSAAELKRLKEVERQRALELVKFVLGHGLELLSLLRAPE